MSTPEPLYFKHYDPSNSESELQAHSGQVPILIEPLPESMYDRDETGVMYRLTFADGYVGHAFQDELKPV